MDLKEILSFFFTILLFVETLGGPVRFPSEDQTAVEEEGRTFHGHGIKLHHHKHKEKKRRKKKKLGCLLHHHHRSNTPDGRTFFVGFNYYDTDIHVSNGGYKPIKPSGGSDCGNVHEVVGSIGSLGSLLPTGGLPSLGGSSTSSSSSSSSSSSPSNGDDNDEDYDYSDGAPSSNDQNNGQGLGSYVSSAPGAVSNVFSTISSGIRPIFERPERYFDYYVVRPFNRSIKNLVSWF